MSTSLEQSENRDRTRGLIPFVPGQSGNPKGRPRNVGDSRIITNLLAQILEEQDKRSKKENARLIAESLVKVCRKGNVKAIKELLDRVEGPVTQKIELEQVAHGIREQALVHFAAVSQLSANIHANYCGNKSELLRLFVEWAGLDAAMIDGFLSANPTAGCVCVSRESIIASVCSGFPRNQQAIAVAAIEEMEGDGDT
jgi:hypothetical protein